MAHRIIRPLIPKSLHPLAIPLQTDSVTISGVMSPGG